MNQAWITNCAYPAFACRADGQSKGGATVTVALATARRLVTVLARAHHLLHGVKVFPDRARHRDADFNRRLKFAAQFRKKKALTFWGEREEFHFPKLVKLWFPF